MLLDSGASIVSIGAEPLLRIIIITSYIITIAIIIWLVIIIKKSVNKKKCKEALLYNKIDELQKSLDEIKAQR